jgi:hypothetical protein
MLLQLGLKQLELLFWFFIWQKYVWVLSTPSCRNCSLHTRNSQDRIYPSLLSSWVKQQTNNSLCTASQKHPLDNSNCCYFLSTSYLHTHSNAMACTLYSGWCIAVTQQVWYLWMKCNHKVACTLFWMSHSNQIVWKLVPVHMPRMPCHPRGLVKGNDCFKMISQNIAPGGDILNSLSLHTVHFSCLWVGLGEEFALYGGCREY